MSRRIGVVTVGRSDYGIYYPVLRAIQNDPECELCLIAAGAHLAPQFGNTIKEIERDGFVASARVHMLLASDSPEAVSMSMGIGVLNFANAYQKLTPDILLLLGDRFEMLAAAVSALPFRIPLGHLHGAELTFGALDDSIRHSISKLSHVHFVSTALYGHRLEQMGEEPHRIHVTGSPVVDAILSEAPIPQADLEGELEIKLDGALLITYHPVTLEHERTDEHVDSLLRALEGFNNELIFTYPNADTGNTAIISRLRAFVACHSRAHIFTNLGWRRYQSLQRYVGAIVGNSSSGMIEAASFKLPVVNIGQRQAGRMRTPNILDVPDRAEAIAEGILRALSAEFRTGLSQMESPYGKGDASKKILQVLKALPLDGTVLRKQFHETVPWDGQSASAESVAQLSFANI
jgi:GDP/UDP-N,N'-diacetylbacillosamine 2-epimerase (hydrolysing)